MLSLCCDSGFDIYLLDWGAPGLEDKHLKFDDYTLEYMPRAIRKVKALSGSEEFSMLGWCIGAILTTIYASLRPDDGLRNLILLTAPLDFSNEQGSPLPAGPTRSILTSKRFSRPSATCQAK